MSPVNEMVLREQLRVLAIVAKVANALLPDDDPRKDSVVHLRETLDTVWAITDHMDAELIHGEMTS